LGKRKDKPAKGGNDYRGNKTADQIVYDYMGKFGSIGLSFKSEIVSLMHEFHNQFQTPASGGSDVEVSAYDYVLTTEFANIESIGHGIEDAFIAGAKWQSTQPQPNCHVLTDEELLKAMQKYHQEQNCYLESEFVEVAALEHLAQLRGNTRKDHELRLFIDGAYWQASQPNSAIAVIEEIEEMKSLQSKTEDIGIHSQFTFSIFKLKTILKQIKP